MKTTTITQSILAALLLSGCAITLRAQSPTPACPLGHQPGYGRTLTAEQKAEQRASMRKYVAELREKQAQGTLTADELAWLQQAEQRSGPCLTGAPRGPGAGKGQGCRNGAGQGKRRGLCDGTGPRNANGTCPNGNTPQRSGRQ